jgi:hypothetical protein
MSDQEMRLVVKADVKDMQRNLHAAEITVDQFTGEVREIVPALDLVEKKSGEVAGRMLAHRAAYDSTTVAASRSADVARQLGFALQDLATGAGMGNLKVALLGASNNLQMLASTLMGPVSGAITGVAIGLTPLAATAFKSLAESIGAAKDALDGFDVSAEAHIARNRELAKSIKESEIAQRDLNDAMLPTAKREELQEQRTAQQDALRKLAGPGGALNPKLMEDLAGEARLKLSQEFAKSKEGKELLEVKDKSGTRQQSLDQLAGDTASQIHEKREGIEYSKREFPDTAQRAKWIKAIEDDIKSLEKKLADINTIRERIEREATEKAAETLEESLSDQKKLRELYEARGVEEKASIDAEAKLSRERKKAAERSVEDLKLQEKIDNQAKDLEQARLDALDAKTKDLVGKAFSSLVRAVDAGEMRQGEALGRGKQFAAGMGLPESEMKSFVNLLEDMFRKHDRELEATEQLNEETNRLLEQQKRSDEQDAKQKQRAVDLTNDNLESIRDLIQRQGMADAIEDLAAILVKQFNLDQNTAATVAHGATGKAMAGKQQERAQRDFDRAMAQHVPEEGSNADIRKELMLRAKSEKAKRLGQTIEEITLDPKEMRDVAREMARRQERSRRDKRDAFADAGDLEVRKAEKDAGRRLTRPERAEAYQRGRQQFIQQQGQQGMDPQALQQVPDQIQQFSGAFQQLIPAIAANETMIANAFNAMMGTVNGAVAQINGMRGIMQGAAGRPRGR